MPKTIARTPQRLGRGPVVVRVSERRKHVARQVSAATAHVSRVTSTRTALPKASDALKWAIGELGLGYAITGCRCSPGYCYKRDCSGLIYGGINAATPGEDDLCGSSFSLAEVGREHGTIIPKESALWIPGAIGIRCPFCDPNFNGSNGHTWWCEGNGVNSIEEGGRRTGCYRGQADKPGDVIYMLWPGFDHSQAEPTVEEIHMFVQTHHYTPAGAKSRPTDSPDSIVAVSADGRSIECRNDASIAEDQPVDPRFPKVHRIWTPGLAGSKAKPLPDGVAIVGLAYRAPDAQDGRPGGVCLCSDGSTRRFHLS